MDNFIYNPNPARVVFGTGTLSQLPEELSKLNITSPFVITNDRTISSSSTLQSLLSTSTSKSSSNNNTHASINAATVFKNATMHTPITVTNEALSLLHSSGANGLLSIGGGSAIGLAKALAVRTGLPHLCVPTTYAGSEMTSTLGETQDGRKTTRTDPKILPNTVVYDVELTLTLGKELTATSGVNAIAHAVEALYAPAPSGNPVMSVLALEGVRTLAEALPGLVKSGSSDGDLGGTEKELRRKALYGTWLCSLVLGNTKMSLHHKICHALGGSFNLPHSPTHTIMLPHSFAYNAPALSDELKSKLAAVLPGSNGDPVRGLNKLLENLGFKGRGLKEFGLKEGDEEKAAGIIVEQQYGNPRELQKEKLKEVIRRAWAGEDARADL